MSLCSMFTCNSKSDEFEKAVTQIGQLKELSLSVDSAESDGEVRSKCWRFMCSSNSLGLSVVYGHMGHSLTGNFGVAWLRNWRFKLDRRGEPVPAVFAWNELLLLLFKVPATLVEEEVESSCLFVKFVLEDVVVDQPFCGKYGEETLNFEVDAKEDEDEDEDDSPLQRTYCFCCLILLLPVRSSSINDKISLSFVLLFFFYTKNNNI